MVASVEVVYSLIVVERSTRPSVVVVVSVVIVVSVVVVVSAVVVVKAVWASDLCPPSMTLCDFSQSDCVFHL